MGAKATATALRFSKSAIRERPLPLEGKREVLRDTGCRGLCLVVTSTGSRSYFLRRMVGGRRIMHHLGSFEELSVDGAREKVEVLTGELKRGEDLPGFLVTARTSPTINEFFERWTTDYAEIHRERTLYHDRSLFRCHIGPVLGPLKLVTVGMQEIQSLHSAIGRQGHRRTANACLQLLSTIFNRAAEWGLYPHRNPTLGVRRFKEKRRERYLNADELRRLFAELRDPATDPDLCALVLVALLTGARRGNIFAMEWSEVDLDAAVWTIPGEKTKTGDDYHLMLARPVVDLLRARRARAKAGARYVFPADSSTGHVYTIQKRWVALLDLAGIEDFRFHDLRHTLAAWQVYAGASLPIIGKTLGHRSVSTTARYAHVDLNPARASIEQGTARMIELGGFLSPGGGDDE